MSEFNTSKNKIRKNWDQSLNNENDLNNKTVSDRKIDLKPSSIKTPEVLLESDIINITPNSNSSIRTTKKGTKLPETIAYDFDLELPIPSEYLAFVDIKPYFITTDDKEIKACFAYEQSSFFGNEVEVKGDSTLIYTGTKSNTDRKFVHSQSEIDNGNLLIGHTKKIWGADIVYKDQLGDTYKITGKLVEVISKTPQGTGCNGFENFSQLHVQIDPDLIDLINYSEVLDINNPTLSLNAKKTDIVWVDTGSGCQQTVTITDNFLGFSNYLTNEVFYRLEDAEKFKEISGEFVSQGIGNFIVDERSPTNDVIQSQDWNFLGYWLYYSTDTRALFGIGNIFEDSEIDDLIGLPDSTDQTGLPLPYTSITLKQNLGTLSPEIVTNPTLQGTQETQLVYEKISKTNEADVYQVSPRLRALVVSEATTENPLSVIFDVYNDEYTVSGTTYTKTTENHTTLEKKTYIGSGEDIQLKISVICKHPLVFNEIRKYINDTI